MKIFKKVKDAIRETVEVLDEVLPPLPTPKPKKEEPKPDAKFVRGLGERLGFAGIVAVTVAAALFGAVGCDEGASTSPATASCDEPASWCGGSAATR